MKVKELMDSLKGDCYRFRVHYPVEWEFGLITGATFFGKRELVLQHGEDDVSSFTLNPSWLSCEDETDRSSVFNTDVLYTVELGYILDVAQSIANSAIERKESRGAHQRLDYTERDDVNYLKHTLAYYNGDDAPRIEYSPVKITKSQPAKRVYGAEAEAAEAAAKAKEQANG